MINRLNRIQNIYVNSLKQELSSFVIKMLFPWAIITWFFPMTLKNADFWRHAYISALLSHLLNVVALVLVNTCHNYWSRCFLCVLKWNVKSKTTLKCFSHGIMECGRYKCFFLFGLNLCDCKCCDKADSLSIADFFLILVLFLFFAATSKYVRPLAKQLILISFWNHIVRCFVNCEMQSHDLKKLRRKMAFETRFMDSLHGRTFFFLWWCVVFCTIYDWFGLRFIFNSFTFHIPNKWWIFDCFLTLNVAIAADSNEPTIKKHKTDINFSFAIHINTRTNSCQI